MDARPKITQEMIDLHDEYTHLTLDRRGFMEKLTKLAGSAAAAAAIAPMIASSTAKAAMVEPTDVLVTSRTPPNGRSAWTPSHARPKVVSWTPFAAPSSTDAWATRNRAEIRASRPR